MQLQDLSILYDSMGKLNNLIWTSKPIQKLGNFYEPKCSSSLLIIWTEAFPEIATIVQIEYDLNR